jgi:chloramphenicol-sensitive protein RarD
MNDPALLGRQPYRTGLLYAAGACGIWGLVMPVYLKSLAQLPVLELLANRVVWASLFALGLITLTGGWSAAREALVPRNLWLLLISATLVTLNWVIYILAVIDDRLIEASLGYFMNPLVSVMLGTAFLGERLRPMQIAACALAAVGVAVMTAGAEGLPWRGLTLAVSFGFYGLVRKVVHVDSLVGFAVEATLLLPLGAAYMLWLVMTGQSDFSAANPRLDLLLLGAGLVTALPLIWFAAAARRLPLSTLGLLQYSAPTGTFLLGTLLYGEPFTRSAAMTFGCIWSALVVYSLDAALARRRRVPDAVAERGPAS